MKTKILISIVLLLFVSEVYSQFKINADGSAQFKVNNVLAGFTGNAAQETEQTKIRYSLTGDIQSAYVCVFDMQGKMLKKWDAQAGEHTLSISGSELNAGTYLYSLVVSGKKVDTKRMILTK